MICIGWDVGGMHGNNNALCIVRINNSNGLQMEFPTLKSKNTPEGWAQEIAGIILSVSDRLTYLAVDAPLSFPKQFREFLMVDPLDTPLTIGGLMNNPLAFRECERYLFSVTKKRLLSASFDQLSNLTLLVLRVFQLTRQSDISFNRLPYDTTRATDGINAFETYPALLNPKRVNKPLDEWYGQFLEFLKKHSIQTKNEHQFDAQLCALFAVWATRNQHVFDIPNDFSGNLKEEGWIHLPSYSKGPSA